MNALGALIFGVLSFVVLFSSRRGALLGIMGGVLYLTMAQQVQLGGVHLQAMRLLATAAFARVLARREFSVAMLTPMDKALILTYGFTAIVCFIRDKQNAVTIIGVALDAFFGYFSVRGLLREADDLRWCLKKLVVLLVPYVFLLCIEATTHHNPFRVLGGGEAEGWVREGRTRCTGSFRHGDLLGTLGSSFFPLYVALACVREYRRLALFGIGLCLAIVVASNSGGPLCSIGVGVVGWLLWRMRTRMRMVRWGMVGALGLLALVMKAPIWYIVARVSAIAGGTGWHRAYLIDMAIQHLNQWWFAGMALVDTYGWFPYNLEATGGADITNQFLSFGIKAGMVAVVLFVILQVRSYQTLGDALAVVRGEGGEPSADEYLLWGLGVTLTVHIVNWFGTTYFDQTYVEWLLQLAAISGISQTCAAAEMEVPDEEIPVRLDSGVLAS